MLLIGRAWKVDVNVWKRHLTLQSVFNRGECIMHVDKNANGHFLDQNVDRISKEIAYVPLSGRIRSKRSSCMQPFFFFEKKRKINKIKNKYKTCLPMVWWIWSFGRASQRFDGLESWTCFPEVQRLNFGRASQRSIDLNLDMLPRGPMDWILDVGSCFQRIKGFGS